MGSLPIHDAQTNKKSVQDYEESASVMLILIDTRIVEASNCASPSDL
jgi:hypothetical protein